MKEGVLKKKKTKGQSLGAFQYLGAPCLQFVMRVHFSVLKWQDKPVKGQPPGIQHCWSWRAVVMRHCQKAADFCTREARWDYSHFHANGKQPLSFFFFRSLPSVSMKWGFSRKPQYGQNMLSLWCAWKANRVWVLSSGACCTPALAVLMKRFGLRKTYK